MNSFLDFLSCIADEVLLLLGGFIVFFVVSKISHLIKARRGNPQKYWEAYWATKKLAEEEQLKDPTYRAQKVWDEQEQRKKENQRQIAHELITATGRYKHRKSMRAAEVLEKIRLEEWPFAGWMLPEYLDGSLGQPESNPIKRKITERIRKIF